MSQERKQNYFDATQYKVSEPKPNTGKKNKSPGQRQQKKKLNLLRTVFWKHSIV